MNIIELYKEILKTGSLIVDKDDCVSASSRGTTIPFTVEGKRLVLPTRHQLKNSNWSDRVVFHPLSENVLKSESLVIEKFRNAINVRLNMVIGFLITEMLGIIGSVDIHKKMSPDQADILSKVGDIEGKTKDAILAVLNNIFKDTKEKKIVHLFIKKGANIGEKRYSRGTIVTFPLYKELKGTEKQVYGVTLRNKDKEAFIKLLEYIVPDIEVDNFFNTGSQSDIAPSLDSLMRTLVKLADRTNTIVNSYKEFMVDDFNEYLYTDDWVDAFDNLSKLEGEIRSIPMQAGNEGQIQQKQSPQVQQPTYQVEPPKNMGPAALLTPQQQQPYQQPIQSAQPTNVGPKGQVYTENGGLDFAATLRNNPALSNNQSPYQNYPQQQNMIPGPAALRNGGGNFGGMAHGLEKAFVQQHNPFSNQQSWNQQPQQFHQQNNFPQQGNYPQQPQNYWQQNSQQSGFGNI